MSIVDQDPDSKSQPSRRERLASQPTSVYRYYDKAGVLLYVGITKQGMGRNVQHNRNAEWWAHVVRQTVEHYSTRRDAAKQEKELIRKFRPPFNVQHNPWHEEIKAAYLGFKDKSLTSEDPVKLYKLLGKEMPLDVSHQDGRELVFVSRPGHESLASRMRIPKGGTSVGPKRGRVVEMFHKGGSTFLVCQMKDDRPVCEVALARLAYKMDEKKHYARLDQIILSGGLP